MLLSNDLGCYGVARLGNRAPEPWILGTLTERKILVEIIFREIKVWKVDNLKS